MKDESKLLKAVAVLLCTLALVSCEKDNDMKVAGDDGDIKVAVRSKPAPVVKGGVKTPVVIDSGDTTLAMWLTSAPMANVNEGLVAENYVTKGERITSGNIIEKRNGNISLTVYGGNDVHVAPAKLSFDKWKEPAKVSFWKFTDDEGKDVNYLWPKGESKFFAWSPSTIAAPDLDPATGVMTLDYTMPTNDASNQPDLIFASESFSTIPSDNTVDLKFEHMLSALHFEIGKTNAMTVTGIKIDHLFSKGKVTYDSSAGTTTWSGLAEPAAFTQTYTDGTGDVHEDLSFKPESGREPQLIGPDELTFMVIPQTSGANGSDPLVLHITFRLKGSEKDIVFTKELTAEEADWQPGMEYRYTLNVTNGLDIEISDDVTDDGTVKQNLQIQNVGGKPAYVRVLVTGNWVNAEGDIIALWDPADSNVGTFSPAIFAGASYETSDWARGADGFFYYRHVLPPDGAFIPEGKQLFVKYTAKESGMPKTLKEGDHLEIDVVSQAVVADGGKASITAAWGDEAAGFVDAVTE